MAITFLSPRIFLSYSRADRDFAGKLATELRRRGFRVLLDTSDNKYAQVCPTGLVVVCRIG